MDHSISLSLALLLGFSSSLHCIGMCGGIIGALSYSPQQGSARLRFCLIGSYNLGRISSYCVAGVLTGGLSALVIPTSSEVAFMLLQSVASLFLLALGFHIAGLLPQLKTIESVGMKFWNLLRPVAGKLVPANTPVKGFAAGMVWGWLPCGLVYSVLAWTLSAQDPWMGGLYMLFFGVGTLPSMLLTGLFSNTVFQLARKSTIRKITGIVIVLMALASFYLNLQSTIWPDENQHSHHTHLHGD